MSILKKIIKQHFIRQRYKKYRSKKLLQTDITLLSNCCVGGTIYNDLGLQFLSPTVNLFFGHHSFIDWVKYYEEYRDAELIDTGKYDVNENGLHGPICLLRKYGLPEIEIHFLHYNDYEEAKMKWKSRYERINPKKIFLLIEAKDKHEYELIDEYADLPFPKVIFTDLTTDESKSMLHLSAYDMKKGTLTGFLGLSSKRGYDEFDFVSYVFNRNY